MLLELLNLDGYTCLWDKYHDPYREEFARERRWVDYNFTWYLSRADKEVRRKMKKARADSDYISCYWLMLSLDGNRTAEKILNQEQEEIE